MEWYIQDTKIHYYCYRTSDLSIILSSNYLVKMLMLKLKMNCLVIASAKQPEVLVFKGTEENSYLERGQVGQTLENIVE